MDKTCNCGKLLSEVASFIRVQQFLISLFIDNVISDILFGKRMTQMIRASVLLVISVCPVAGSGWIVGAGFG